MYDRIHKCRNDSSLQTVSQITKEEVSMFELLLLCQMNLCFEKMVNRRHDKAVSRGFSSVTSCLLMFTFAY